MILRRLDKQGNEMFVKDYSKEKSLAQIILKNSSTFSTGEPMWEVIPEAPKSKTKKKK
jgi:hypothetical protein